MTAPALRTGPLDVLSNITSERLLYPFDVLFVQYLLERPHDRCETNCSDKIPSRLSGSRNPVRTARAHRRTRRSSQVPQRESALGDHGVTATPRFRSQCLYAGLYISIACQRTTSNVGAAGNRGTTSVTHGQLEPIDISSSICYLVVRYVTLDYNG